MGITLAVRPCMHFILSGYLTVTAQKKKTEEESGKNELFMILQKKIFVTLFKVRFVRILLIFTNGRMKIGYMFKS